MSPEALANAIRKFYGDNADDILKAYAATTTDEVYEAAAHLAAAAAIDPAAADLATRAATTLAEVRDLVTEVRAYREHTWADPDRLATQLADMRANVLLMGMGGIAAFYPTKVPFHYASPDLPPGTDLFGEVLSRLP